MNVRYDFWTRMVSPQQQQPIQVLVAMEFGYDLSLIHAARQQRTFASSADLMEYIDSHPDLQPLPPVPNATPSSVTSAVANLSLSPPNPTQSSTTSAVIHLSPTLPISASLLHETQCLYASLHCYMCGIRKREIVLMPCSELLLCQRCVDNCTLCPRCQSPIKALIHARWI